MNESRTRFDASMDKRDALRAAESAGQVADSHEVRLALLNRMHAGELTLEQVQAELKRIKRSAKAAGLLTRAQAFNRG